jgi:hypothetical protein
MRLFSTWLFLLFSFLTFLTFQSVICSTDSCEKTGWVVSEEEAEEAGEDLIWCLSFFLNTFSSFLWLDFIFFCLFFYQLYDDEKKRGSKTEKRKKKQLNEQVQTEKQKKKATTATILWDDCQLRRVCCFLPVSVCVYVCVCVLLQLKLSKSVKIK